MPTRGVSCKASAAEPQEPTLSAANPCWKLPSTVTPWHDVLMNTSISLPNDVFESADELAQRLGASRGELHATAVAEYLAKFRGEDITARLNPGAAAVGRAV